ncbi:hypothetical protein [Geodermatophilus sabuli]|uniref:hypothetical protein n=1 Tax=Geodermatophilus sabuli TaxID=1564158 RepID=UPI001C0E90C4|nr:hypothetical protein [Geodermatophilus sabuli]
MVTALRQVVLPALPKDEPLAREQASLCIGQLVLLAEQVRYTTEYELLCLAEMRHLGSLLADAADGGPAICRAAASVRAAITAADDPVRTPRERRNAVAREIDALLHTGTEDGTAEFRHRSHALVLAHGVRQSTRDRGWFRACGWDPDADSLPSVPEMIAEATS